MTDTEDTINKGPILNDVSSAFDKFKQEQGWKDSEPEPVVAKPTKAKKDAKLKKSIITGKQLADNKLNYNARTLSDSTPKKTKKNQQSPTDFSPRKLDWLEEEEEYYKPTKSELTQRKRDEEIKQKKKARDTAIRDHQIYNALIQYINREIIYPLYHGFGWMLISKLTKLNVNRITNTHGFQPYEQTKEERVCLLVMLRWDGDGPEYGTMAKSIEELGCPSVFISRADDVKEMLNKL